jgi:tetratricopeptide (TPR) repeat protein
MADISIRLYHVGSFSSAGKRRPARSIVTGLIIIISEHTLAPGVVPKSQVADLVGFGAGLGRFEGLQQVTRDFQQLVRGDPNNPDLYFILDAMPHRGGRHEVAIDAVDKAIAPAPAIPDYHCVLGEVSPAPGRLDTAADSYREAICIRPDEARAHEGMPRILVIQGRHEPAIGSLLLRLSIRPDDGPALASPDDCLVG